MKLSDVTSRADLIALTAAQENGDLLLSCGNKYSRIKKYLSETPDAAHPLKVKVIYTACGKHTITRYL